MHRIFNCGIGMVLIVEEDESKEISKNIFIKFQKFYYWKSKRKDSK